MTAWYATDFSVSSGSIEGDADLDSGVTYIQAVASLCCDGLIQELTIHPH
jgi:hypothetical protein